jgi:hypothetical protein
MALIFLPVKKNLNKKTKYLFIMKNVITIWNESTPQAFESNIPLLWSGKRNLKLGSKNNLEILLLDGVKNYPRDYLKKLQETGYQIHDVKNIYDSYSQDYLQLNCFGDYEKKCFLRWLVIKDFFNREPILHVDADVVFNELPEILAKKLKRFTFVLQGCPAFAAINNPDWLAIYKQALDTFTEDIEGYSRQAWKERAGWKKTFNSKWAGSRVRRIISSDQDFISHLTHTDRLPQDKPKSIKAACPDLIFFENPLLFFELNQEMIPFSYKRQGSFDFLNNKKVAIWHMQTNFVDYLKRALVFRNQLHLPLKIHSPLTQPRFLDQRLYRLLFALNVFQQITRLDIYRYFFHKKDFAGVFNNQVFWQNVFSQEAV